MNITSTVQEVIKPLIMKKWKEIKVPVTCIVLYT